jgi:hypothetical protein
MQAGKAINTGSRRPAKTRSSTRSVVYAPRGTKRIKANDRLFEAEIFTPNLEQTRDGSVLVPTERSLKALIGNNQKPPLRLSRGHE